ncbi:hypothetical protein LIA77_00020 [Sarocladium implicatum]|nr:hypothetical protein LIA77_00020 [Sarocladium implicatum]
MCTAVPRLTGFCLLSLLSNAFRGVSLEEASQAAETTLRIWRECYKSTDMAYRMGRSAYEVTDAMKYAGPLGTSAGQAIRQTSRAKSIPSSQPAGPVTFILPSSKASSSSTTATEWISSGPSQQEP